MAIFRNFCRCFVCALFACVFVFCAMAEQLSYDCYDTNGTGGYGTPPDAYSVTPGNSVTLESSAPGCQNSSAWLEFGGWSCYNWASLSEYSYGWDYQSAPINNGYSLTMPSNNVKCNVRWIGKQRTLTYHCGTMSGGGTPPQSVSFVAGDSVALESSAPGCNADLNAYNFVGWYCVQEPDSYVQHIYEIGESGMFFYDTDCYAVWDPVNPCTPGSVKQTEILGGTTNSLDNAYVFSTDVVGMCSSSEGTTLGEIGTPSSSPGSYCWCRATSFSGTPLNDYPWVFVGYNIGDGTSTVGCDQQYCRAICLSDICQKEPGCFFNNHLLKKNVCGYTVDYNCGSGVQGSPPASVSDVEEGNSVPLASSAPSCTNSFSGTAVFDGWDCYASADVAQQSELSVTYDENAVNVYVLDSMPADNVTCIAQWDPLYRVTYKGGNCGPNRQDNYTYSSPSLQDNNHPVRPGYSYSVLLPNNVVSGGNILVDIYNAYTNTDLRACANFGGYWDGIGTPGITYACNSEVCDPIASYDYGSDINLYAYCDWEKYDVIYHPGSCGGSDFTDSNIVTYNQKFTVRQVGDTNVLLGGKIFNGWTTDSNAVSADSNYVSGTLSPTVTLCEENRDTIDLYAVCTQASYTLTYNVTAPAGAGISTPAADNSVTGGTENYPLANVPTATGYTCSSWSCVDSNSDVVTVNSDNQITLMPSYNVTCSTTCSSNIVGLQWLPNGGTLGTNSMPGSCVYNTDDGISGISPNPTKTGYTFNGWLISGWDSVCGANVLQGSQGSDFFAVDWHPLATYGNKSCRNWTYSTTYCGDSVFSDLNLYEFKVVFDYGTVYGVSKCSDNQSASGVTAPSDTSGQYCWCSVNGYTPAFGSQCNLSAELWAESASHDLYNESNCLQSCAFNCARDVMINNGGVMYKLYGITQ